MLLSQMRDMTKRMYCLFHHNFPKITNLVRLEDFRPISLVDNFYKIIAKIIGRRLQKIIDHKQSAFI